MSGSYDNYHYNEQYSYPQSGYYSQQTGGGNYANPPEDYTPQQYQPIQPPQYAYNLAAPSSNQYPSQSLGDPPVYPQQSYASPYDVKQPVGEYRDDKPMPMNYDHNSSPPQSQYQQGESASYYNTPPEPPVTTPPEGEKGLVSTVAGAAGGGILGHKLGGGVLSAAGGALAGVAGMKIASKFFQFVKLKLEFEFEFEFEFQLL
ncbi:hypothetical protein ASPCADRAFT_406701 [Aspergillus carbonarius ITEM 5010]|uniref:Glycine zipper 2TM domain-containing protein n=1 Tax=Aspergillus carbonarius (strain ITEM 5010) TaxID=602072 RepID=A0A1R3RK38_ASPC5|nr:hypothetical protein ASPCADRAFT_406701 [Aspergillus carbonarius ITEM 5010]